MKSIRTLFSPSLRGSFFILISALMFGSYGVFSKYLDTYPIFFQTYVRCSFITIILALYGILTKKFKRIEKEDYVWIGLILFFTSFSIAPIVYAFQHLTLGTASFLFYSAYTMFTFILGRIFFKEKITRTKIISLIFSFVGMILIFSFDLSIMLFLPAFMAIVNGLASSAELVFSKKVMDKYTNIQLSTMIFAVISITHFVISIGVGEQQSVQLLVNSSLILGMFIIAGIIGMVTVLEGFKLLDASISAIIGLTEIIFSVVLGVLLFQEEIALFTFIGGMCILFAAALPNMVQIYTKYKGMKLQ